MLPDPAGEFRKQAREWLATSRPARAVPYTFQAGSQRVVILGRSHLRAGHALDAILLVQGDFSCGPGCSFLHPVYVSGGAEIGKGSRLKAAAVAGSLVLGPLVGVEDFADAGETIEIRSGCRIAGAAIHGAFLPPLPGSIP